MTPSQRVAFAIEISRAALRFAHAERVSDDRADVDLPRFAGQGWAFGV
jgi:hypothetical protein